jgi:hypothetical protein
MSTELTKFRVHLKEMSILVLEAILLRDLDNAQDLAETLIALIRHVKAIEKREAE